MRKIARWVPLGLLIGVAGFLWAVILRGGLAGAAVWYVFPLALLVLGALTLGGVLVYAFRKRRWRSPAVLLTLVASMLALVLAFSLPIRYPASLDRTGPAATVRLPANVPLKVAWGGDLRRTNYHVIEPSQRWAYDLLIEPYQGGTERLGDYGCYGVPIVAPAAGLVTVAHDGEPDAVPGIDSNNSKAPEGNYVAIRLEPTGTHLLIAHLQPGSVAVRKGERVAEGDVIGRCGNSGNTSEPHIHIHHQRQDPAAGRIAEGLPLYFRDHDGPPMPTGGWEEQDGKAVLLGPTVRHVGPRARPEGAQ